jgi:voltage-gated potassium channel
LSDPQTPAPENDIDEQPSKVPLTARLMLHESLSARRAAAIIAAATVLITVAGGLLERVFDHKEFHTAGKGLWFALQTVTTVGYGDATPQQASGRIIGGVIMLAGIAFLAVITAAVTAALIESSRRRFVQTEADMSQRLVEMSARLARIEAALERTGAGPGDPGSRRVSEP